MKKVLPNLHNDGFELTSGVKSHEEAPQTFWIPSNAQKAKVERGSLVKLSFNICTLDEGNNEILNSERMWVIVSDRDGDWFTGVLDNQPQCTTAIKPGLVLSFTSEYIINIYESKVDLDDQQYVEYRVALEKAIRDQ